MKREILALLVLLTCLKTYSQAGSEHYLGVNLLQLPASTVNLNYSFEATPFLTPIMDIGYAFDYHEKYDVVGGILTRHIDLYDGYSLHKQSGGYLKLGGYINLRRDFERNNFPHLGIFITNSIVHEEGKYLSPMSSMPYEFAAETVEHNIYLFGLSSSIGYEVKITNRLKTIIDFQFSFPTKKYKDLYSYNNFIPGMGYKDTENNIFPMLILNLKYRL